MIPRCASLVALAALLGSGCSIQRMAVNSLAGALAESGDVYASDDDPQLVGDALPFALKTFESLLAEAPEHEGLLLATCSGFVQYAYAFVELEADKLEFVDYPAAERGRERALKLYLRGRDYCLQALELGHPGVGERLVRAPEEAAAELGADQLDLVFWTGAAWGSAISIGVHRLEIVADLPAVRALMDRVLELDEGYDDGAAHEALIALEALPEAMGGSKERAREHFERAVELSRGLSASPYVSLAANVTVAEQDRGEFERLLGLALEVDPDAEPSRRLANTIARERAELLLSRVEDLFLDLSLDDEAEGSPR